jgi:putative ABC transport system substrate-binding protein
MRRRDFISVLGGAAAAPILRLSPAHAQQSPIRPLIGVLSPISATAARQNISALRSGLRDLGYVEGRNVTLIIRHGDGFPERMAPLAQELVSANPDVLLAGSRSGALAAREATRTIPIIVTTPEDPVASGFANSMARPGGNVTGMWSLGDDALVGKRLGLLQLAVPGLVRVGMIFNPDDPTDALLVPRIPPAAQALGLTVTRLEVRDLAKLDAISPQVAQNGIQALFIGQSPTFNNARAEIARWVARQKLPAVYGWREFVEAGGLISYGPSLPDLWRQAARLMGRILKGESPGDLPFELPTRYELIVNLKTAKAMDLKISDSFLLLADEVIE